MTQELIKSIAEAYGTTEDEMFKRSKKRNLADARSMLAYILTQQFGCTKEETAAIVRRDRATVFNMLKTMSNLLLYDAPTKAIYEKINVKICKLENNTLYLPR